MIPIAVRLGGRPADESRSRSSRCATRFVGRLGRGEHGCGRPGHVEAEPRDGRGTTDDLAAVRGEVGASSRAADEAVELREVGVAAAPPRIGAPPFTVGSWSIRAIWVGSSWKVRLPAITLTGAEIARSATARAPFRSGPVIAGCWTAVGSSTGPERPKPASAATTIFAAALRSSSSPGWPGTIADVQPVADEARRLVRPVDLGRRSRRSRSSPPPGRP